MRRDPVFWWVLGWITFGLAAIAAVTCFAQSTSPSTYQIFRGYKHIRPGGVMANDTQLTMTTSSWHDVEGWVTIPQEWDSVSISFYCFGDGSGSGDPASGVFDANVLVVHEYGSAIPAARLTVNVGNLQMSHDPAYGPGSHYKTDQTSDVNHKWAEGPFTINEQMWRSPVQASGKTNGIGELSFSHSGATRIKVLIDNMSGVTTIYVVMTGRKR